MRLDFVEVCGFRGFRDPVRIDFGAGFTILTGRNGTGKSTLCDAIEYAVVGELGKYNIESAAKETVKDYIWWRGDGTAKAHYVRVGFRDGKGNAFSVTRTRESGADKTPAELVAALCQGAIPENSLRQLCKTNIIRDEWIAALSLDLSETQRFDLVRAALGSVEGADLTTKAKEVVNLTEVSCSRAENAYEQARAQLSAGWSSGLKRTTWRRRVAMSPLHWLLWANWYRRSRGTWRNGWTWHAVICRIDAGVSKEWARLSLKAGRSRHSERIIMALRLLQSGNRPRVPLPTRRLLWPTPKSRLTTLVDYMRSKRKRTRSPPRCRRW